MTHTTPRASMAALARELIANPSTSIPALVAELRERCGQARAERIIATLADAAGRETT